MGPKMTEKEKAITTILIIAAIVLLIGIGLGTYLWQATKNSPSITHTNSTEE